MGILTGVINWIIVFVLVHSQFVLVQATYPFWVVQHGNALLTSRLDPILSPGGVSGHVHSIIGTSSFKPTYDFDNSQSGQCTTANVAADKSSYWVPQLYRKQTNGTFSLAKMNRVNTYYLMRKGSDDEVVYEFPKGFKMLAGNANRGSYNSSDYTNTAISYVCLGVDGSPQTPEFPTQSCPEDLRAQIVFPNCWDGVNTWLEGSAHVHYPLTIGADQGGLCPDTHPKRIMTLFYEFHFSDNYPYEAGARVLATGDDVGYSLHGDFTNGWPVGLFQQAFDRGETCAVEFSIENCPPLAETFNAAGSQCVLDSGAQYVNEDIGLDAPISKLPGNNPVWGGSVAKASDPNYVESAELTTISIPITQGWTKMGCLAEPSGQRALQSATQVIDDMTPELCISFCAGKGYKIAGIEYSDECYCANSISGTSLSAIGSNGAQCAMSCPAVDYGNGYCGGPDALSIYQYGGIANTSSGETSVTTAAVTESGSTSTSISIFSSNSTINAASTTTLDAISTASSLVSITASPTNIVAVVQESSSSSSSIGSTATAATSTGTCHSHSHSHTHNRKKRLANF